MHERHGHSAKDRLYRIWVAMRQRCNDPKRVGYASYGGRGITVCEAWRHSFSAFKQWADGSGYADHLSIDRFPDPDGNYEPGNCRWATAQEQAVNRSIACLITIGDKTMTVAEWAKHGGYHLTTLYRRYRKGVRGAALIDGIRQARI